MDTVLLHGVLVIPETDRYIRRCPRPRTDVRLPCDRSRCPVLLAGTVRLPFISVDIPNTECRGDFDVLKLNKSSTLVEGKAPLSQMFNTLCAVYSSRPALTHEAIVRTYPPMHWPCTPIH